MHASPPVQPTSVLQVFTGTFNRIMSVGVECNAHTLLQKRTALLVNEQGWQAATDPSDLVGWTAGCQE